MLNGIIHGEHDVKWRGWPWLGLEDILGEIEWPHHNVIV